MDLLKGWRKVGNFDSTRKEQSEQINCIILFNTSSCFSNSIKSCFQSNIDLKTSRNNRKKIFKE